MWIYNGTHETTMLPNTENTSAPSIVTIPKLIDDETAYIIEVTFYVTLNGLVSIIGIVANVINIIVFIKQGVFSDSCTMGLLGLAISDFFCVLTLLWLAISIMVMYEAPPGLNWDPASIMFNTAGRPHSLFSHVTCFITALISLERCVCVLFPFKVKLIFTAKRTMFLIPFIFAFTFLMNTPLFMLEQLQWYTFPGTNTTMLLLVNTGLISGDLMLAFNYINPVFLKFTAIFSVMVFNVIITQRVKMSTKWRSIVASGQTETSKSKQSSKTKDEASFQKENNLVNIISAISTVFLICYSPDIALALTTMSHEYVNHSYPYHNLFHVLHSIVFFFEGINSSVNIIIYYKMSTRYREEFRKLMRMK